MEHAVLDIYVNGEGSGQKQNSNRNLNPDAHNENTTGRVFKRPRTRSQSHGMDILANLKDKLGDAAYSSAYQRTLEKTGGDVKKASANGKQAEYGAKAGIALAAFAVREAVSTTLDLVGTFTTNQAKKNELDNLRTGINMGLGAAGTIGAGAAVGGAAGAAIAIAMEALKLGFQAVKTTTETSRKNQENTIDSERKRNRLGYIEAGYSR